MRCKEELRHRRRLGEKLSKAVVSAAHREHVSRGLRMARGLLEAGHAQASRVCYQDALLFVLGGGAALGGGGTTRASAAPSLPEVPLRLACLGSRDEAFEALHNLVHCEQVRASQLQTREARLLTCQRFGSRFFDVLPS